MDKGHLRKEASVVKKHKLQYIIHNPNTAETTAKYILDVLIDANTEKVERVIQKEIELHEQTLARHLA